MPRPVRAFLRAAIPLSGRARLRPFFSVVVSTELTDPRDEAALRPRWRERRSCRGRTAFILYCFLLIGLILSTAAISLHRSGLDQTYLVPLPPWPFK